MAMANRDAINPDSASHISISGPRANLRNPLPLSAAQEAEVKNLYYKRVRSRCAPEIKDFAACAAGRTVTATWHCRTQRLAMNSCMILHATSTEEDAAREEWFAGVTERRRKKEEDLQAVERRREEVIELTKRQEEKERIQKEEEERRKRSAVSAVPVNTVVGSSDDSIDQQTAKKKSSWWG